MSNFTNYHQSNNGVNANKNYDKSQHFLDAHCVPGPMLGLLYTFQLIDEKTEVQRLSSLPKVIYS